MTRDKAQTRIWLGDDGKLKIARDTQRFEHYPNLEPGFRRSQWMNRKIHRAERHNAESSLLQLPKEILSAICEAVSDLDIEADETYDSEEHQDKDDHDVCLEWEDECESRICPMQPDGGCGPRPRLRYEGIYSLMLACKSLHVVAVPFLYASVQISNRGQRHCSKLSASMHCNPLLRPLVRNVSIIGEDYRGEDATTPRTILESIKFWVKFPRLMSLDLGDSTCSPGRPQNLSVAPEDLPLWDIAPSREAAATFVNLHLRDLPIWSDDALIDLLKWPSSLQTFSFSAEHDCNGCGVLRWLYAHLTRSLSIHRSTLRVLEFCHFSAPDAVTVPAGIFPSLHTLRLPMDSDFPIALACQNWLTASLRTLALAISEEVNDLKTLQAFARAAASHSKRNQVGLQNVVLVTDEDLLWWYIPGRCVLTSIAQTLSDIEKEGFCAFWRPDNYESSAPPHIHQRQYKLQELKEIRPEPFAFRNGNSTFGLVRASIPNA